MQKILNKKRMFIILVLTIVLFGLISLLIFKPNNSFKVETVTLTNSSSNSMTLIIRTENSEKLKVWYGKDKDLGLIQRFKSENIAYDDRDMELTEQNKYERAKSGSKDRAIHHITIHNLEPDTNYYFWVGTSIFPKKLSQLSTFKTISVQEDIKTPDPIYSRVLDNNEVGIADVIVQANLFQDSRTYSNYVSTYTNSTGGWVIDKYSFVGDDSKPYTITSTTQIAIKLITNKGGIYEKTLSFKNYKPLEYIKLLDTAHQTTSLITQGSLITHVRASCVKDQQECQNPGSGNTGYLCTCIDIPPLSFRCSEYNAAKCPIGQFTSTITEGTNPTTNPATVVTTTTTPSQETSQQTAGKAAGAECSSCSSSKCGSGLTCQSCSLLASGDSRAFCIGEKVTGIGACIQNTCGNATTPAATNPGTIVAPATNANEITEQAGQMGVETFEQTVGFNPNLFKVCTQSNGTTKIISPIETCPTSSTQTDTIQNVAYTENNILTQQNFNDIEAASSQEGDTADVCIYNQTTDQAYCNTRQTSVDNFASNAKTAVVLYLAATDPENMPVDKLKAIISYQDGASAADQELAALLDQNPSLRQDIADYLEDNIPGLDLSGWKPSMGLGTIQMTSEQRGQFADLVIDVVNSDSTGQVAAILSQADANIDATASQIKQTANKYGCTVVNVKYAQYDGSYTYTITLEDSTGKYWTIDFSDDHDLSREEINAYVNNLLKAINTNGVAARPNFNLIDNAKAADTKTLKVTKAGQYDIVDKAGNKISTKSIVISENNIEIKLFNDLNKNGVKDKNEPYLKHVASFNLNKVSEAVNYNIVIGWNLINLPIIVDNVTKASDLITYLDNKGLEIIHVARFVDSTWNIYTKRENNNQYANDFELIPGQGLFIYSKNTRDISVTGRAATEAIPIEIGLGWNLIGINQTKSDLTAFGLVKSFDQKGVKVDTISQYSSGQYKSIIWENNTLYGNDFNIFTTVGYFVKSQNAPAEDIVIDQ